MIKKFDEFVSEARAKFGEDTFTYLKDTFTFYTKPMTIIHNPSGQKFEMIPQLHLTKSNTGIPKELKYVMEYPFEKFIADAKYILGKEFVKFTFSKEHYYGKNRAMLVLYENDEYYISPSNLFKDNYHLISVNEVEEMKNVISKYKRRVDFRNENKELEKYIIKNGLCFLFETLDYKVNRVIYSEEYLRNLMMEYKNAGKSRSLFVKDHGSEHAFIKRHNLIHLYYECGLSAASELQQGIYACEFHLPEGNYAYIGLTYNFSEREADHRGADPHSTPCKFIKEHNLDKNDMIFKILLDIDDCKNPSEMEEYYRQKYEKEGWVILNSAPTGARGHRHIIVESREDVEKFVKEHNITSATRLYHDSRDIYRYAEKNGFLEEIVKVRHLKTNDEYDIEIKESIIKCKTYVEWRETYDKLYYHLCDYDRESLMKIQEHFKQLKNEQFICDIQDSLNKHKTYREWCDNNSWFYNHLLQTDKDTLLKVQEYYGAVRNYIAVCNVFDNNRVLFVLKSKSDIKKYGIDRKAIQDALKTEHKTYKSFIKFKEIRPEEYERYINSYVEDISVDDFSKYKNSIEKLFGGFRYYGSLLPLIEYDSDGNEINIYVNNVHAGFSKTKFVKKYQKLNSEYIVYQKRRFKSISIEEMYRILAERNPELATLGNYFPC